MWSVSVVSPQPVDAPKTPAGELEERSPLLTEFGSEPHLGRGRHPNEKRTLSRSIILDLRDRVCQVRVVEEGMHLHPDRVEDEERLLISVEYPLAIPAEHVPDDLFVRTHDLLPDAFRIGEPEHSQTSLLVLSTKN